MAGLSIMADDASTLSAVCSSFCQLMRAGARSRGERVVKLFNPRRPGFPLDEVMQGGESAFLAKAHAHGAQHAEFLSKLLCALQAGLQKDSVKELDLLLWCLKTWVAWYVDADGDGLWMVPFMMHLSVSARKTAARVREPGGAADESDLPFRQYVEAQRQIFQTLARERERRPGFVWVSCELLRAYFRLGQVGQVAFLLSAIETQLRTAFNPRDLPKSIAVTLYYFWGKHCVFDDRLDEADKKLSWAFSHCPVGARSQRRKILLYLVPCRLRRGVLPTQGLLKSYSLDMFVDIVRGIRQGNARLFSAAMEKHMVDFIKNGTYFLLMRLRALVLRNLVKAVHREERRRQGDSELCKMDLDPFEQAFAWQDDCDIDETASVLSSLIVQGSVKGYLSHSHRKLVFAKSNTFPPPSQCR